LQNTQTLRYILQNHILPNVEVRVADMVIGASWPTINPNEQLTVQSPVAPAIANGNLRACNTLIHETNVVLVPAGAAGAAMVATAAQTPVATTPVPAPQVAQQVVSTQQQQQQQQQQQPAVVQQQQQSPATTPASFSSDLDITKINANFG